MRLTFTTISQVRAVLPLQDHLDLAGLRVLGVLSPVCRQQRLGWDESGGETCPSDVDHALVPHLRFLRSICSGGWVCIETRMG